jgi:hypothetical protein
MNADDESFGEARITISIIKYLLSNTQYRIPNTADWIINEVNPK